MALLITFKEGIAQDLIDETIRIAEVKTLRNLITTDTRKRVFEVMCSPDEEKGFMDILAELTLPIGVIDIEVTMK